MSSKKFLLPLAAAFAALAASANASTPGTAPTGTTEALNERASNSTGVKLPARGESRELQFEAGGDLYEFTLKRSESGEVYAAHRSHISHRSHSSHRSHYSSR